VSWVYQKTEPCLYTVGFYDPQGKWHPDSDYNTTEQCAQRIAFLNGNPQPAITVLIKQAVDLMGNARPNEQTLTPANQKQWCRDVIKWFAATRNL